MKEFLLFILAASVLWFLYSYALTPLVNRAGRWLAELFDRWRVIVAVSVISVCFCASATEARLNIEARGSDVLLWVSGGTSNVQYQIYTSPDNNAESANWYYWRRAYSADFKAYSEILVTSTNTPWRTRGFYQIRGVLPDLKIQ